ncbi:MAG: hypothetical protein GXX00_08490 [Hungateiclostridium thermocellum]|uniref:GIY-YIG catalytic domain-containing protein n=1 Tax=Acetivibrio thermocellus (strain ATCC 27405 / DSM 1237 / JCM 9322 / NBRC 103400 / NCIMB 10682 / NRRL B-4536 / VPI 7372) TaxID=203119 RepID=A3DFU1_ACET2|nr:hypothetical protein [Acetivibrio thermocellus]ABN52820.1 hypothetical protein Cthe_1594 [Acetivibrio thermocellus ATCC 27405]NLU27165.1 hypothetical protein [Acetivibrio thermocellus]THJ77640.1 hypothetical protein EPD62_10105 [Acetivibrio thermocellus]
MLDKLMLKPIPRSFTEGKNRMFIHYKFDMESEEKLTNWMRNNLSLSFYEYEGDEAGTLGEIEAYIIEKLKPILNLAHNGASPWDSEIRLLRRKCADLAKEYYISD